MIVQMTKLAVGLDLNWVLGPSYDPPYRWSEKTYKDFPLFSPQKAGAERFWVLLF